MFNIQVAKNVVHWIKGSLTPMNRSQDMYLKVWNYSIHSPFIVDISAIGDRYTRKGRQQMGVRKLRAVAKQNMFCNGGTNVICGWFL
jgi:hypothetical protein